MEDHNEGQPSFEKEAKSREEFERDEKLSRELHEEYKHRGYVKVSYFNAVLLGLAVLFVGMLIMCSFTHHRLGYRDGQIDYYNKIIKWKLVENSNGTREWKQVEPK